jgi:hypothetical protein
VIGLGPGHIKLEKNEWLYQSKERLKSLKISAHQRTTQDHLKYR